MESSTAVTQPSLTRDETGTLLGQTMGLVAVTAGLFALGAYLGRDLSYGWGWVFYIASFACLIGLNVVAQRSEGTAIGLLFGFGVLIGLGTAPTIAYYASTDPKIVWQAAAQRRSSSPASARPATQPVATCRGSLALPSGP